MEVTDHGHAVCKQRAGGVRGVLSNKKVSSCEDNSDYSHTTLKLVQVGHHTHHEPPAGPPRLPYQTASGLSTPP